MKPAIVLACLITGATLTMMQFARAQAPHAEYYDYVYKIQIDDSGKLKINVWKNGLNGTGCSTPYYAWTDLTVNDEKVKAWYQMALASYLSRTKVWVATSGCTGGPQHPSDGYPILQYLQIVSQQD
jgi:hypothetical protein